MFLLDSNILIYSYSPEYKYLRDFFTRNSIFISEITRVEILGFHKLTTDEERYFKYALSFIPSIFPSQDILNAAISVRRKYNIKLGDSIIAATALVHDLSIYTRNLKDFEKVGIECVNPMI